MFNYPDKTKINKQFTLKELFKLINCDKELKLNASSIDSICLSNVLSKSTTNLNESENVKEIYIIDVFIKENIVPNKFIDRFNKNINFQTLFRIRFKENTKYIMSLKTFTDDKANILLTFESDWQKVTEKKFPSTLKLVNVFKEMLKYVSGCEIKDEESFEKYAQRFNQIKKLKSEIAKLTKQVNAEKQPNLRMELNDKLKQIKKELKELDT